MLSITSEFRAVCTSAYIIPPFCRSIEDGSEASSGLGELFTKQVSHMSPSHLQFFAEWLQLLAEEEQCSQAKQSAGPWLAPAQHR